MRRVFRVLMICACLFASGILPVQLSYAKSAISDFPIVAEDAAVFYLVPHQLTASLNKSSVSLDSVMLKAAPLLKKNGQLYFPFKWLETAHLAKVKWDAKTGSSWAEFNSENRANFSFFRLMPNRSKIYLETNGSLEALDGTIPTTFTKNGQLYVPVSLLPRMGVNYSWSQGVMHLKWSDKVVKVIQPTYSTQNNTITFSALVQKEFGHVYMLQNMGDGGFTSMIGGGISSITGTEKTIGGPIIVGDREFRRIEYTVDLRPGENPFKIYHNYMGSADIIVHREVSDPSSIPILYNHPGNEQNISFTKPTQGYLRIQAGESIAIAGTVSDEQIQSNVISFQASMFQNGDYHLIGKKTVVPLDKNKDFSGSVVIQNPGTYLVNIYSPDVFIGGSSPYGSLKWAEIAVEVLPKGIKK
ncbi:hypothetical protein PMSD_27725 [Paenibacillus macquariensis subsp. defensor]|nr:hypothetical protein PMSD_27725 [Paenibacillus macquariensis subsp. defensor]